MKNKLSVPAIYQRFIEKQDAQFQYATWNQILLNIGNKKELTAIHLVLKDYSNELEEKQWKKVQYMLPIALLSLQENEGYSIIVSYLAIDTCIEKAPVFEIEISIDLDHEGSGHALRIKKAASTWPDFLKKLRFVKSGLEWLYAQISKAQSCQDGQGKYVKKVRELSKNFLTQYKLLPDKEKKQYAKYCKDVEAFHKNALKETARGSAKTGKEANTLLKEAFEKGDIKAGWTLVELLTNAKNDQKGALDILKKLREHPSQKENLYQIWQRTGIAAIKGNDEATAQEAYKWLYKQSKENASKKNTIRNVLKYFSTHSAIAKNILAWFI